MHPEKWIYEWTREQKKFYLFLCDGPISIKYTFNKKGKRVKGSLEATHGVMLIGLIWMMQWRRWRTLSEIKRERELVSKVMKLAEYVLD